VACNAASVEVDLVGRISGKRDSDLALERLGAAIRAERNRMGVSQEALADAASMDRAHMGKIERGERNVTFLNLLRISSALKSRPSDLLRSAKL
jgi:transcriptional regulator with XRE-family HTH domain